MSDQEDRFPGLTETRARQIEQGLEKRFPGAVEPIPWERWEELKSALVAYKRDAGFLRGFLNKGQIAKINKVAKQAARLRSAILETNEDGLAATVEQAVEPLSIDNIHELLNRMEKRLSIQHRNDFLPDVSRRELYWRFEQWWKTTTGLKAEIAEGSTVEPHPTPFMYVANEVFSLPGMPPPTGASYATLKGLRRELRNERHKIEEFGAALRRLQGLQKDDDDSKGH
jgi:hypothetical protein